MTAQVIQTGEYRKELCDICLEIKTGLFIEIKRDRICEDCYKQMARALRAHEATESSTGNEAIEIHTVVEVSGGLERSLIYAGTDKHEALRITNNSLSEECDVELCTWKGGHKVSDELLEPD